MIMLAVASNDSYANIFSESGHTKMHYESLKLQTFKHSNIAKLVCILFLFSCYFISKYIITCILIIINAILMSFR